MKNKVILYGICHNMPIRRRSTRLGASRLFRRSSYRSRRGMTSRLAGSGRYKSLFTDTGRAVGGALGGAAALGAYTNPYTRDAVRAIEPNMGWGIAKGAGYGALIGQTAGGYVDKRRSQYEDKSLIRTLTGSGAYKPYRPKRYSTNQTFTRRSMMTRGGKGIGPIKFRPPKIRSSSSDTGAITITNREYIGDVVSNGQAWQSRKYEINPGLRKTFQKLSSMANNFTEYRFSSLVFTYESVVNIESNATQTGTVIMCPQYRTSDPLFESKRDMLEATGCVSNTVTKNLMCGIECNPNKLASNKILMVRDSDLGSKDDLNDYDSAYLQVSLNGVPMTGQLGELWATYSVTLSKPSSRTSTKVIETTIFGVGTEVSRYVPFTLSPWVHRDSNIGVAFGVNDDGQQYLEFDDDLSGVYEFLISYNVKNAVAMEFNVVNTVFSYAILKEFSQKVGFEEQKAELAGGAINGVIDEDATSNNQVETGYLRFKIKFFGTVMTPGERRVYIAFQNAITSSEKSVVELTIREAKQRGEFMNSTGINEEFYEKLV